MAQRAWSLSACVFSAAVLLICAGAAERAGAESAAPTPNGDDILLKARQVWDAQSYPTRIDYVVAVRVVQNGTAGTKHYAAEFAPASTDLHVTAASNETLANPEPPHGITVRITREARGQKSLSIPVNPEGPADYLGVPLLFPTYSFGLAHPRGLVVEPSPAPVADSAAPGVIGTVVARTRTYLVTCLGEEDYGQGRAFHLVLRPVRDPGRYRLRELWVDAARYSTLKAVVEGNFADGPGTRVNWMVTFHTVDGAQYIDTETAVGPLKLGPSQKFDEASISFESIQAHHGMPPARFMFEQLPIRNALMEPKS